MSSSYQREDCVRVRVCVCVGIQAPLSRLDEWACRPINVSSTVYFEIVDRGNATVLISYLYPSKNAHGRETFTLKTWGRLEAAGSFWPIRLYPNRACCRVLRLDTAVRILPVMKSKASGFSGATSGSVHRRTTATLSLFPSSWCCSMLSFTGYWPGTSRTSFQVQHRYT